jgi:hypothetical protein
MTVSITYYGTDNQFWNAGPGGTGLAAKDVRVNANSNSNTVNFNASVAGIAFTGTIKGDFQFNGPISTLDKVSGTLTELTSYANGLINEYTAIPQGTDLLSWIFPSTTVAQYISTASTLNRGVTFVGSQGGQEYGDTLIAGTGKDSFTSYGGKITKPNNAAYFDGKGDLDLAILQGKLADYKVQTSTFTDQTDMSYKAKVSGWQAVDSVTSRNGTTQVVNVERLKFSDTMLALDTSKDQTAGSGYMLYKAAFNRTPDAGGLGYWINQMDKGMSYSDVAKNFVTSAEFQTAFGGSNPSVNTLVTKLYNNVLARTPDAGGLAFWQNKLSNEGWTTADVLGFFSTSGENVTNVTPLIANGIQYQQFVG